MTQLQLEYPAATLGTMVERVPVNRGFGGWFEGCKRLRGDGWDVTVLLASDERTAVMLACRP